MLLGNNINRTQQSPVVIYSIPVPPKSSTALSLQTTQTSFDPNYVAVRVSQKWPMQDLLYTQQGHCVRHSVPVTLQARARVVCSGFHSTKAAVSQVGALRIGLQACED